MRDAPLAATTSIARFLPTHQSANPSSSAPRTRSPVGPTGNFQKRCGNSRATLGRMPRSSGAGVTPSAVSRGVTGRDGPSISRLRHAVPVGHIPHPHGTSSRLRVTLRSALWPSSRVLRGRGCGMLHRRASDVGESDADPHPPACRNNDAVEPCGVCLPVGRHTPEGVGVQAHGSAMPVRLQWRDSHNRSPVIPGAAQMSLPLAAIRSNDTCPHAQ